MTIHLPECRYVVFQQQGQIPEAVIPMGCICAALRACEQRVWDEAYANGFNAGRAHGEKVGYAAGVQAARDAVAREAEHGPLYSVRNSGSAQRGWDAMARHALAAIDALRGES